MSLISQHFKSNITWQFVMCVNQSFSITKYTVATIFNFLLPLCSILILHNTSQYLNNQYFDFPN